MVTNKKIEITINPDGPEAAALLKGCVRALEKIAAGWSGDPQMIAINALAKLR